MHHPTDVMAGALMGAAALALAALVVWIVASPRATRRADVAETDVAGEPPGVLRAVS